MSSRRELRAGARAMVPWLAGLVPFGLVIGVAAAQADIPSAAGWLTAPTIYAGSAQLAAIQMLDAGAGGLAVILTVILINLRLVLYSGAIARYWRGTPLWWRLLGAYLLVDPSFAVGVDRYARLGSGDADRRRGHAYYLGGAVLLWVVWLTTLGVGVTLGARVPDALHLELLAPLYLLGEIVPKLREAVLRRVVLTSAVTAVVCLNLPLHLGIVVAIVTGLTVGGIALQRAARPAAESADTATPTAVSASIPDTAGPPTPVPAAAATVPTTESRS